MIIKKIKLLLFLITVSLCVGACGLININGSLQGLYSYYKRVDKESPGLLIRKDSLDVASLRYDAATPAVYMINGKELKNSLKKFPKAVVYSWRLGCSSQHCHPLGIIQDECDKRGIAPFVVAEYYDSGLMQEFYEIERPIFGIDTEYYKTNLTSGYLKGFFSDLNAPTNEKLVYYFEIWQF